MLKQLFLTLTIATLASTAPAQANCSPELADKMISIMYTQAAKSFTITNKLITEQFKNIPYADAITVNDINEVNAALENAVIAFMASKKPLLINLIGQKFADDQEATKYLAFLNDEGMQKFNAIGLELASAMMPVQADMIEIQNTMEAAINKIEAKISAARDLAEAAEAKCNETKAAPACCADACDNDSCALTNCDATSCSNACTK